MADIGADAYWTNLHKWGFGYPTCSIMHSPRLGDLGHVVPSWTAGTGLFAESRWTGTRDYASFRTAPLSLAYLDDWRSVDGRTAMEHNRLGYRAAAAELREAWGVGPAYDEEACTACMGMVRLPPNLDMSLDAPGKPSTPQSVRSRLRDRFGVEAAVGGFPVGDGIEGFVRLSHAVYTSDEDVARLRDAVLVLLREEA